MTSLFSRTQAHSHSLRRASTSLTSGRSVRLTVGFGAIGLALSCSLAACGGEFDASTVATGANEAGDSTDIAMADADATPTVTPAALSLTGTPGGTPLAVPNPTAGSGTGGLDLSGTKNGDAVEDEDGSSSTGSGSTTSGGSSSSSGGSSGSTSSGGSSGSGGSTSSGGSGSGSSASRTETVDYVVQPGDVLGIIAERYGVSASTIAAANGITPDSIRVGQTLKIPPPGTVINAPAPTAVPVATAAPTPTPISRPEGVPTQYIVAPGDTWASIAAAHGVTEQAIAGALGVEPGGSLPPGRCLIIPPVGSKTSEKIEPTATLCPDAGTPQPDATATPAATETPSTTPEETATPDPNPTATAEPAPADLGDHHETFDPSSGTTKDEFTKQCEDGFGKVIDDGSTVVCDLPG